MYRAKKTYCEGLDEVGGLILTHLSKHLRLHFPRLAQHLTHNNIVEVILLHWDQGRVCFLLKVNT
jgi:hypothetical protein